MKDEIKEILDNTLEYLEGIDETRNTKILTTNETNILLDYITNLQEENERLKIKCDFLVGKKMVELDKNAKQIEIKAIEQQDYKTRNEKAIEYINNGYLSDGEMVNILARQDLLNILQGKSDE